MENSSLRKTSAFLLQTDLEGKILWNNQPFENSRLTKGSNIIARFGTSETNFLTTILQEYKEFRGTESQLRKDESFEANFRNESFVATIDPSIEDGKVTSVTIVMVRNPSSPLKQS